MLFLYISAFFLFIHPPALVPYTIEHYGSKYHYSLFLIMGFLQVELGFENGIVDDIFFVPGYDLRGHVVAQVKLPVEMTIDVDYCVTFNFGFIVSL